MNSDRVFGAYVGGHYMQCVARDADEARLRLWVQCQASALDGVRLSSVEAFAVATVPRVHGGSVN